MKTTIALWLTMVSLSLADEPKSLIDAINATWEARAILMLDLQEATEVNVRSEYNGCPTLEEFKKILEDEKRYNAAARRWFKEMGVTNADIKSTYAKTSQTADAKLKALLTGTWREQCNGKTFVFQADGKSIIGDVTEKWDIQGGRLIEIRPDAEVPLAFSILFLTKDECLAREDSHGQGYIFLKRSDL